jgi:flagellar biosynthesis protein FlhF
LFVSEVNSLLAPGEQTETILVLSMTHKYSDMKMVASQFAKYGVEQLLLTKFDETDTFGAVINLVKEFDFKISYITCGQAVPDDIRPFEPEDLVKRILGGPADD